jgi:hypothetical protein
MHGYGISAILLEYPHVPNLGKGAKWTGPLAAILGSSPLGTRILCKHNWIGWKKRTGNMPSGRGNKKNMPKLRKESCSIK